MVLKELMEKANLRPLVVRDLNVEVNNGICTDLLSIVIGGTDKGSIWVTHQGHINVVAVSVLAELAAVVVTGDIDENTIRVAKEKGLNLFATEETAFNLAGRLYSLGILGKNART